MTTDMTKFPDAPAGSAPEHTRLRQASASTNCAPAYGSR